MPKKNRIDDHAAKELDQHISAVQNALFEFRFRLSHYFAGREEVRERFTSLEKLFQDYASDFKKEVARRAKENKQQNA